MTEKERRTIALNTHILDVPGLWSRTLGEIIEELCEEEAYLRIEEETPNRFKDRAAFRERFREVPGLRLKDVRRKWPLKIPHGYEAIRDFAFAHGLCRVDWLVLPYNEREVMRRLRTLRLLNSEVILQMSIFVFGFLDHVPTNRWILQACGVKLKRLADPSPSDVQGATIGRFLSATEVPTDARGARSIARLRNLLLNLGFTKKQYPVLQTGLERLVARLMEEEQLPSGEAARVLNIAIRQGWVPKSALM